MRDSLLAGDSNQLINPRGPIEELGLKRPSGHFRMQC
jgi:hypothetical protein